MRLLRISLAQVNPTVGDISGNIELLKSFVDEALALGSDLIAFPELAVSGYPPEDLLLRSDFVEENLKALHELTDFTSGKDILVVMGFVDKTDDIHNAAAMIHDGRLVDVYHKAFLPNYGVFDDKRYFMPGERFPVYLFRGVRIGVNVCEDIWHPDGPLYYQSLLGDAEIIVNINASPYHIGKWNQRETMLSTRASDNGVFVVYLNSVGGQDELVFDGGSVVFGPDGELVARAPMFKEGLFTLDLDPSLVMRHRVHDTRRREQKMRCGTVDSVEEIVIDSSGLKEREKALSFLNGTPSNEEEIWNALLTGVSDYTRKNGFKSVVIGLSGGIDSALVSVLAADAIGRENVHCLFMPSRYTSRESREDAFELANNLGVSITEVSIDELFRAYLDCLAPHFKGKEPDITEENIQARIRGNILMAFSNKFGHLVLTTGNKSELSTGYSTLYGDLSGGFAPLKDVPKTLVYKLARFRNSLSPVIPERMFTKPPSAELKPNQTDQDTLPPYEILDPILQLYIEEDASPAEIIAKGFDPDVVRKVIKMVDSSEYKRRQAPPGIKITERAFGRDRRMPITNRFGG
ncbi:MAG: NAD+ synthase [candidate division WOR-3 bacterium]